MRTLRSAPRVLCWGWQYDLTAPWFQDSGARLGLYEIVGPLGAGEEWARVYRACDTRPNRDVARRCCRTCSPGTPGPAGALRARGSAPSLTNHPNIAAPRRNRRRRVCSGGRRDLDPQTGPCSRPRTGRRADVSRAHQWRADPARRGPRHRPSDSGSSGGGARASSHPPRDLEACQRSSGPTAPKVLDFGLAKALIPPQADERRRRRP